MEFEASCGHGGQFHWISNNCAGMVGVEHVQSVREHSCTLSANSAIFKRRLHSHFSCNLSKIYLNGGFLDRSRLRREYENCLKIFRIGSLVISPMGRKPQRTRKDQVQNQN